MLRMINACFGLPCAHELPALKALGVEGVRSDCQHQTPEVTAERAKEIVDAGLVPLIVVRTVEQLALLPDGTNVELRNEPDLEGPKANIYADLVNLFSRSQHLKLWAGVVSNLNARGFKYLRDARVQQWPENVNVSVHRYANGDSPEIPHDGFRSREHEVETLKSLIGNRFWCVSEVGFHTAGRKSGGLFGGKKKSWSDAQVAEFVAWEWRFLEEAGAQLAAVYQLNDGPSGNAIDRYGIRNLADGSWKPAAHTFARTT